MNERRKDDRVKVELEVSWEGALTQLRGSLVDLSTSGCFILTDDQVKVGELVRVIINPPRQNDLYIWGEVVYQIPEMGFAVRFTGADDSDMKQLELIVKAELYRAQKNEPAK
jgi:hypothetical protein